MPKQLFSTLEVETLPTEEPKNSMKHQSYLQSSNSTTSHIDNDNMHVSKTSTTTTTTAQSQIIPNEQTQQQLHHKKPKPLWPAVVAGATQAILFNPIDRALYLRVHNRETHLFVRANWAHPFQGFANAAVYRTISGATYLFFQDTFKYGFQTLKPEFFDTVEFQNNKFGKNNSSSSSSSSPMSDQQRQIIEKRNLYLLQLSVGTCAGAANGLCLNWFQLIKFRLWSEGANAGFFPTAKHIYDVGGPRMFFRGAGVSVMRDVSFGIAYEVLRAPGLELAAQMKHKDDTDNSNGCNKIMGCFDECELYQFGYNATAGAMASVFSSPFNYCRNLMYGSSTCSCPLRVSSMVEFLAREIVTHKTPFAHMNARLNLGWGTVRVGIGIACGQGVYSWVNKMID